MISFLYGLLLASLLLWELFHVLYRPRVVSCSKQKLLSQAQHDVQWEFTYDKGSKRLLKDNSSICHSELLILGGYNLIPYSSFC